MPRAYKTPRTFKSPETYQKWLDGGKKGGLTPKIFTPEGRQKQLDALRRGVETNKRKALLVKEQKEKYNVEKAIDIT